MRPETVKLVLSIADIGGTVILAIAAAIVLNSGRRMRKALRYIDEEYSREVERRERLELELAKYVVTCSECGAGCSKPSDETLKTRVCGYCRSKGKDLSTLGECLKAQPKWDEH